MTIVFPDIASYQAAIPLDNLHIVSCKATEGTNYVNPDFHRVAAECAVHGRQLIAYHWPLPNSDYEEEARHLLATIPYGCPIMLDWEGEKDQPYPSSVEVERCATAIVRQGGNLKLTYYPRWLWENQGEPDLSWFNKFGIRLVSSNYSGYSDDGVGWQPYGNQTPLVWQFSSTYPLNGYSVDMNAYRGTVEEFLSFLNGDIMSATSDDFLRTFQLGMPSLSNGEPNCPVQWEIRREAWEITISQKLNALMGGTGPVMTDAQVQSIISGVSTAILAHPSNGMTEADVETAVRNVLHSA